MILPAISGLQSDGFHGSLASLEMVRHRGVAPRQPDPKSGVLTLIRVPIESGDPGR